MHVWVLELWEEGGWVPCAAASLTREEARLERDRLMKSQGVGPPAIRYRVRKYVPAWNGSVVSLYGLA